MLFTAIADMLRQQLGYRYSPSAYHLYSLLIYSVSNWGTDILRLFNDLYYCNIADLFRQHLSCRYSPSAIV